LGQSLWRLGRPPPRIGELDHRVGDGREGQPEPRGTPVRRSLAIGRRLALRREQHLAVEPDRRNGHASVRDMPQRVEREGAAMCPACTTVTGICGPVFRARRYARPARTRRPLRCVHAALRGSPRTQASPHGPARRPPLRRDEARRHAPRGAWSAGIRPCRQCRAAAQRRTENAACHTLTQPVRTRPPSPAPTRIGRAGAATRWRASQPSSRKTIAASASQTIRSSFWPLRPCVMDALGGWLSPDPRSHGRRKRGGTVPRAVRRPGPLVSVVTESADLDRALAQRPHHDQGRSSPAPCPGPPLHIARQLTIAASAPANRRATS